MSDTQGMSTKGKDTSKLVRKCKATCHDKGLCKYPGYANVLYCGNNAHIFVKQVKERLTKVYADISSKSKTFICLACFVYALSDDYEEETQEGTSSKSVKRKALVSPEKLEESRVKMAVDLITSPDLTSNEVEDLAFASGKMMSRIFIEHATKPNKSPLSIRVLNSKTYAELWTRLPPALMQFYNGMLASLLESRRITSNEDMDKRHRSLLAATDCISHAINFSYVSPKALAQNIYTYFLSNSIRCVDMFARIYAAGSSKTIANVYSDFGKQPSTFPKGFIFVAIDNTQIIGKSYRIYLGNKQHTSTVTNVVVFKREIEDSDNPQYHHMELPFYQTPTEELKMQMTEKLLTFYQTSKATVNKYLTSFMELRLNQILETCEVHGGTIVDSISKDTNPYTLKKPSGVEYSTVPDGEGACNIFNQEIITLNPNSYNNVQTILDQLVIKNAEADENRKWFIVVADGIPYSLGLEIVRKTKLCSDCSESFMNEDGDQHYKDHHSGTPKPNNLKNKYQNIMFRPGNGHYELNIVRSMYAAFFPTILEPVCDLIGYRTPAQKQLIRNGRDHHRSWQLLEIMMDTIVDELLYSFVVDCHQKGITPKLENFTTTVESSKNYMAIVGYQFAFWFGYSLFLFRAAIRQCNHKVAIQAREVASGIFYGFHHPNYQKINVNDVLELIQCPQNVREHVFLESLRRPDSNSGQGLDFLLEEENKALKRFVLSNKDTPTNDQWLKASRSMDNLQKIVAEVKQDLNILGSSNRQTLAYSAEKLALRRWYRSNGTFDLSKEIQLTSSNPEVNLSQDFIKCRDLCERNRKEYYRCVVYHNNFKISYVPITTDDESKEDSRSWTKKKLQDTIRDLVKYLPDEDQGQYLRYIYKKSQTELVELLDQVESAVASCEMDEEDLIE